MIPSVFLLLPFATIATFPRLDVAKYRWARAYSRDRKFLEIRLRFFTIFTTASFGLLYCQQGRDEENIIRKPANLVSTFK